MSDKRENPPAFPQFSLEAGERDGHGDPIESFTTSVGGMTLRDYFAGQALAGLVLKDPYAEPERHAWYAYRAADAMLIEREGNQ